MTAAEPWLATVRAKLRHVAWSEHRAKISRYRERDSDYVVWARVVEQHAEEHRPTSSEDGSRHSPRTEERPCLIIAGDFSSYD